MEVIFVLIQYLSYKDGRKSGKCVLNAFKSEAAAKKLADSLCCSFDDYDVVVSYEPIDLI